MLNHVYFENARPAGISTLEVVGTEPLPFVPLKRTDLRGEVIGPLAALRLTHSFGFSSAQCDHAIDAIYRFPMPGDATVRGVAVRFGDVSIRVELKEREKGEGETELERAKSQGRPAAITLRESPDVFSLQISGIAPDQNVTVETLYIQVARPQGAGWRLRVPLTSTPRYAREEERRSRVSPALPLTVLRAPEHRFSLNLLVGGACAVQSTTHGLTIAREGSAFRVRLANEDVLPDRDCILSWESTRGDERPALQVFTQEDVDSGHVYFLALVAPPASYDRARTVPREMIVMVDYTGSMNGSTWRAAEWAVARFLGDLSERESFNLGLVHTSIRWFSPNLCAAQWPAVKSAMKFLKSQLVLGGRGLGVALEQAFGLPRVEEEHARHILVISDSAVTYGDRVLELLDEDALRDDRRRVSILGIDSAPNSFPALQLAERGGGVSHFLTSEHEAEDITTALEAVLAEWSEPIAAGLRLEVDQPGAQAVGREVAVRGEVSSIDLGELFASRALWVAGRVPATEQGTLRFRLVAANGAELTARNAQVAEETLAASAIKPLFGARRVLNLEHVIQTARCLEEVFDALQRLGYDHREALPSLPEENVENLRQVVMTDLRTLLAREALDFSVASSETTLVARRREAGNPVETSVPVVSALPAGWPQDFLGTGPLSFGISGSRGGASTWRASASFSAPQPPRFKAVLAPPTVQQDATSSLPFGSHSAPPQVSPIVAGPAGSPQTTPENGLLIVYSGQPALANGETVLFDSTKNSTPFPLPGKATFNRLIVQFPDGDPDPSSLDPALSLLLYLDDLASPRAKVRIVDLARLGGERPLHVRKNFTQPVRIVLVDPNGAWRTEAQWLEVFLGW